MEYKAKVVINARLMNLLEKFDARQIVSIYKIEDGKEYLVRDSEPVYKLWNFFEERPAFANYEVVGLNVGITTNILIAKHGEVV